MDESAPSAATGTAGAERLIQKGAEIAGGAFAGWDRARILVAEFCHGGTKAC